MERRWTQPIPQAMQQHGTQPKKAPPRETVKQSREERKAAEPRHVMAKRLQDQAA